MKQSILLWVLHRRSTGSSCLRSEDFFLVRCSLALWECSLARLAKSSAGAVLLSRGCKSAMAPSKQVFSSGSFGARFILWILPICHSMSVTDVLVTQYFRLIATAVIYAWIYNSTKGSLFLVMVAHAAHNITVDLMPQVGGSAVIVAVSYVAVAIVVALATDPRTLTVSKAGKVPN
jgi:hypothetical protein